MELKLVNDLSQRRYRLTRGDEELGYIEYDPVGDSAILLKHTEVLPQHEGQGFGSQLVRALLDEARRENKSVIPICPYALNFIRRHREYLDVVRADMRTQI